MRTRQWAPITILGFVFLFSALDNDPTAGHGSKAAGVAGLVVGSLVVYLIHLSRKPDQH